MTTDNLTFKEIKSVLKKQHEKTISRTKKDIRYKYN